MAVTTERPSTTSAGSALRWVVALLAAVLLLQLVGLLMLASRTNDLQQQVDRATGAANSAAASSGFSATDADAVDACRILGGLAGKDGIDLAVVFRDQPVSGDCELAAEAAARAVRSGG